MLRGKRCALFWSILAVIPLILNTDLASMKQTKHSNHQHRHSK